MSAFFITAPTPDRPEREHVAYRLAVLNWNKEKAARLALTEISEAKPVTAQWPTIKKAQEDLAHCEDATCNAVELYVEAIRHTEDARDAGRRERTGTAA